MLTKIQAMRALEEKGLNFTANIIMNGCSSPTRKMNKILKLIEMGHDVRQAQVETCAMVIDGKFVWFGDLAKMKE